MPIKAAGEAGNGIQVCASSEGIEQTRERLIAFTNYRDVDAIDGADQFGAHFIIEVSAAEHCHDARMTLLQAPGQSE